MPAKGALVKEELITKLLEVIPNSFRADKDIRVNMTENGSPVQIKIALTAVKNAILDNPKTEISSDKQFSISDEEVVELENTLKELGVEF